jgi:WD40 repeat protein
VLPVFCSQFTKNGSLLAMGNRYLTLYDRTESNKWNFKTCFENHEKDLSSLCFNDKGTILVTGSAEGVIIVFAFLYGAW